MTPMSVIAGEPFDRPIETFLWGGSMAAAYASGDTLSAAIYPARGTTEVVAPTTAWYTAGGTLSGYEQGRITVSATGAQTALLMPSASYTLIVWITPISDPTRTYPVARIPLRVDAIALT